MKFPPLEKIISVLIDNVWDVTTIVVACIIIAKYLNTPLPQELQPIAQIYIGLFLILGLLAISGLWERWRRLSRIETNVKSIQFTLNSIHLSSNRYFFNTKQEVINATTDILKPPLNMVWFSGITLRGTIKTYQNLLIEELLKKKKHVRIMIVSSFSDELMDELTRRSGAGSREYWRHCIVTTEQAIEDIGKLCGTKGCLEIGQLPFMPSFGIVMVNPRSEEVGRAIVEVYHHDRSPLNATFSLDVKNDPYWFIEYQKQYEILWSKCNVKSI